MHIYKKQYFLNYPADGGEPYFIFVGKERTKSKMLKLLMCQGYSEPFSELLIETGYAFGAMADMRIFYLHVDERLEEESKNNWHLARADQNPYEIRDNGMIGYWEAVECLYENGLTWENAREAVAQGRYEEIMREKGRSIDEGPCDLSGWDSLYDHEVSEELCQQVIRTNCKFPHTREQTIGVIKMLMAFGYTSVMAEIVAAEGLAPLFVARGCLVYRSIKEALRDKKTNVWHGLDEPATAPYMVTSEGEKYTYYDFLWYCMGDGDSVKRAMRKAETLRPEMLE